MSLLRKIGLGIAAAGLAGMLFGCEEEPGRINNIKAGLTTVKTDERYFAGENEQANLEGKIEKITTQIEDIQYGSISVNPTESRGESRLGIDYGFIFVVCKGGDGDGLTLIYPHKSKAFRKYTPVEITIKRLKDRKISTKSFYLKYISPAGRNVYSRSPIEADGIIEPDGVKYLGEGK